MAVAVPEVFQVDAVSWVLLNVIAVYVAFRATRSWRRTSRATRPPFRLPKVGGFG